MTIFEFQNWVIENNISVSTPIKIRMNCEKGWSKDTREKWNEPREIIDILNLVTGIVLVPQGN